MTETTATERIVELLRQSEVVRARELSAQDVHPMTLQRLVEKGVVEREGRGFYRLAEFPRLNERGSIEAQQLAVQSSSSVIAPLMP